MYLSKRTSVFLLAAVVVVFASCSSKGDVNPNPGGGGGGGTPPTPLGDNDPILLGNPTNAVGTSTYVSNFLKNSTYYKIGYNSARGTSNWVAWHLQSEDLGSAPRQDDFRGDAGLPSTFYVVQDASYSGSGFDRGHNCPSADRTSTIPANSSTFLMTNMIPQAPNLNQGPWDDLEEYIRTTLVGGNKEAFIVMGNAGMGGYNSSGTLVNSIDGGHVIVPNKVWKVVLIMPKGNGDLARLDTSATILAVNMPNDNRIYTTGGAGRTAWRNYLTTISALEADVNVIGDYTLNLLRDVPDAVRNYLKAKLYH